VIGVNSAHFVGEPFNYAVPAERISELLDSAGVENTVSDTTETYRDGVRAYFAGDRETAVADLEQVLEEQPANGLAEDYLAKAKDLPADTSDSTGPVALWASVAVGVVVAIAGGLAMLVALLRRLRRPSAPVAGAPAASPAAPVAPAPAATQPTGPAPAWAPPAGQPVPTGFAPTAAPTSGSVATLAVGTRCGTCGNPVDAGDHFCGTCGARQA
jgi:hypothetical protein